ncbi:MAG: hypothetical protein ABSG53_26335, partial [Thermoguttaceae bacterium]
GAYSFGNLVPGTYYVQEVVPTGYIQTGGGPNGVAGDTYYTISAQSGQAYSGNNFDDFLKPTCTPSNVSYKVTTCGGSSTTVTGLGGNTQQGDKVTVTFTTTMAYETLTLVSYVAPGPTFNVATAYQQQIFDEATGTYATPGTYSLTVQIPNCDYQIDFVCGAAICELGPPVYNGCAYGPDSADVFYTAQGRLVSSDNEGTQVCGTPCVQQGDFATTAFWNATCGKNLLYSLNGGSSATGLGNWLASNFPHLYGAQVDSSNACEKDLAGATNAAVDGFFATLCSTNLSYAQILSTALACYASDTVLAGCTVSYFYTSVNGNGLNCYNVGTCGSVLGLTGSQTVLAILHACDQQAYCTSNFTGVLSSVNTICSGINTTGNIT